MKKTFNEFLESKSISVEKFNDMDAESKAELYKDYNVQLKEFILNLEKELEDKADKSELDTAIKEFRDTQMKQMEELNKTIEATKEISLKIIANKEGKGFEGANSIKEGLKANIEKLKGLASNNKQDARDSEFSFKVAGNMTITGNVSGGNIPVEDRLAGVNMIASRQVRLLDIISRGTTSSNVVSWVYQANQDGTIGYTDEGTAKDQIDFDLVVDSESVQKIAAYIKVSTEMINDIDYIETLIRAELMKEILKYVEEEVYEGAGGGSALNGISTQAASFSAGTFAGAVDNANEVDVLSVAMNQIALAEQEAPTYILMNPSDVTNLKLQKVSSTDKRYVERLVMVAGQLSLDGVPIIPTTLVAQDDYLVGDFSKNLLLDRDALSIDVGLDGNDFTENFRTILAEWRGVNILKNNDTTCFVAGVFSTDAAALETP